MLALIALFTGAFLVFSVLALSVAKRAQQFALLGVLGLAGRDRLALVLWEALALGLVGSAAGIALGSALAALALNLLGGDLGGGYVPGVAPQLPWQGGAALLYGLLGVAAALVYNLGVAALEVALADIEQTPDYLLLLAPQLRLQLVPGVLVQQLMVLLDQMGKILFLTQSHLLPVAVVLADLQVQGMALVVDPAAEQHM